MDLRMEKENGKKIKMEIVIYMKVNINKIRSMVKENSYGQVGTSTLVNSLKMKEKARGR